MREHYLLEKNLSEKGIDTEKLLKLFPAKSLNVGKPFMMIVLSIPNIYAPNTLKKFGYYILNQSRDMSVLKEITSFVGLITE